MKKNNYKYSMGIMNYCSHDPGCALIRSDGQSFDYIFAEEGFLSRKKKSYHFPLRSMKYCLDFFGLKLNDVDVLMLDFMDQKTYFRTSVNYRLLIGDFIRSRLDIQKSKIHFSESHHFAHALTTFWPSGYKEAGVLVVDGLGSHQQTHSVFRMDANGRTQLIYEQKGVGIGTLYTLSTRALGFESGEEGKTMGLAPYGAAAIQYDKKLPDLRGQYKGLLTDYSAQLIRNPSPQLKFFFPPPRSKKELYQPFFCRFAYKLQQETERCLMHLAAKTLEATKSDNLCFAGGVALNCVANHKIRHIPLVKQFYIQPASGDTGVPIGLAIAGLEKIGFNLATIMTKSNREKLARPFSCDSAPLADLEKSKLKNLLKKHQISLQPFNPEKVADALRRKKIVALLDGGIELGPRALGHRSFLADAREEKMKRILNAKIKHREGYRPFAPAILQRYFNKYFQSSQPHQPYMLEAPRCTKHALKRIPAACHVDLTARAMTVNNQAGKISEILEHFNKITNVPVLINTSFNDNEEPIVFSKIDALCCFLRCNADLLVLNNQMLDRKQIKTSQKFLEEVTFIQKKLKWNYFRQALQELTLCKRDNTAHELYEFLDINQKLSNYNQTFRILNKIIFFLQTRNIKNTLYLDKYHYNQISQILAWMGENLNNTLPNYKIVDDSFSGLEKIPNNSEFILYNASGYFHSHFVKKPLHSKSFYELNDKILNFSLYQNLKNESGKSLMSELKNSYEFDPVKTIEDFFANLDKNK